MNRLITILSILLLILTISCKENKVSRPMISKQAFGSPVDGKSVFLYTLRNSRGMEVRITNYGAIIQSLIVPDRDGKLADVVLGYDRLADYLADNPYFGAVVGRYGNRIAAGRFTLNDQEYTLTINNGPNHLHGGLKGFDKVVWDASPSGGEDSPRLELTYLSPDGEEGYPGNLQVKVNYSLNDENELVVSYHATTDKPTPCNLTQHSYFNLSGNTRQNILDHELRINADYFTPVDETLIPTGELRPVAGTPFDFKQPTPIGARIGVDNQQIQYGLGYDHNWILNDWDGSLQLQASLYHPGSGRRMEILTTEPGLQFYSGNFLDGSNTGKDGIVYEYRSGLCLETQHFPDSPNQADFPSTILRPGEVYKSQTVYRFSVK